MGRRSAAVRRDVLLHVGYYKPGDDFAAALEASKGDAVAALSEWAALLEDVASSLRSVAGVLSGAGIKTLSGFGDAHSVELHDVPEALISAIKATGIAYCHDDALEDQDGEEG